MKAERTWALIAAFILFSIYTLTQHAYMTSLPDNIVKLRHVYTIGIIGCFLGALLLPFLLPLNDFLKDRCTQKYKLRLVLTALFFLPNIIIRLLGEEAYLSNPVNSGIMALGNGVIITLMHGFIFSMKGKYRLLWITIAFSAANLIFSLNTGQGRELFKPFLFLGSGLLLTIAGVLLFVYLLSDKKLPEPDNIQVDASIPKRIPYFIFPIIAALIIFTTNSFTNQLFFMVLNSPLPPGFNFSNIALILMLPLFGYLAALSWRRFLMIFIPVCSIILLLAPSLLLFARETSLQNAHSQPLFLILYTLNTITVRMITAVFPFIIVDMFWQFTNIRKTNNPVLLIVVGCLGWLLPVSINMISMSASIPKNLFNLFLHDKPSAVTLLTIAAIVFYILMWLVNKNLMFNGKSTEKLANSANNLKEFFKEFKLTEREIEVACLLLEEGMTSEKIAGRIFRSTATVSSHLTNIFRKLNVQSRTEFMAKVIKIKNN
ncbi:MAG: helix-turn-helix transcriptional regulator [Treponema sp.]|nr:helix-turn-helix transcriptional regulator [Treponema sp.]